MRFSFRLAQLLGHDPHPKRRTGLIKSIAQHTGLDRHKVAALLKNRVKSVPLDALSKICDYLIDHGLAQADQLPGALFAIEPENFWELLAQRERLQFCIGVRQEEELSEAAWVVASDAVLFGELLHGVSRMAAGLVGGTGNHGEGEKEQPPRHPAPHNVLQTLLPAPDYRTGAAATADSIFRSIQAARDAFDDYIQFRGEKALICLGSIKSNPVCELILSETFHTPAFHSEDDIEAARDRACPFFFRFRDGDPKPASSSGGLRLAANEPTDRPGIYYEQADGAWECVPWDADRDAALVFFVNRPPQGRLEMVLGGFSGRATRLLARTLADRGHDFSQPVFSHQGLHIGAYLVDFTLQPSSADGAGRSFLTPPPVVSTRIIPLDADVLATRLTVAFGGEDEGDEEDDEDEET